MATNVATAVLTEQAMSERLWTQPQFTSRRLISFTAVETASLDLQQFWRAAPGAAALSSALLRVPPSYKHRGAASRRSRHQLAAAPLAATAVAVW